MRPLLTTMLAFIFLTSFFGGTWMMIDHTGIRSGLERSLLLSTPFRDFFLPGVLMILFISLPSLAAGLLLINNKPQAPAQGILSGGLLCSWIIAQMIIIPGYTGLSILYLVLGIMICLLSLQLKGKWVV